MNIDCDPKDTPLSPMSGDEPAWDPQKWKQNTKYNNCYAYAIDDHNGSITERNSKPIPGKSLETYICSDIITGLYKENPEIYSTQFECRCQKGYKKIFAAVSDEPVDNDFHFWRQDSDGLWSHKPGSNLPSRYDAKGLLITNPENSNRTFSNRNYVYSCGYFCVPLKSTDKS
jgi:hypothetical protein